MLPDLSSASVETLALTALIILLVIILKVADRYLPSRQDETSISIRQILANMNGLLQVLEQVTKTNTNITETLRVVGKLQSDMHNMQSTIAANLAVSSEKLALIHQNQEQMPTLVAGKIAGMR